MDIRIDAYLKTNILHVRRVSSTVPACVGKAPALQSLQLGGNIMQTFDI